MSTTEQNVAKVKELYAAWSRGDLGTILEAIHPECIWELGRQHAAVPWLAPRHGRSGAEQAFKLIGSELDFTQFEIITVLGEGPWVVALCNVGCVVKRSGKTITETCEPHVWQFDEGGRVVAFRHAADTLHQAAAV